MRIIILVLVLSFVKVYSQDPNCCHKIWSYPSCQTACDLMAIESTSAGRRQHIGNIKNNCPSTLSHFWTCVNNSAPDIWQKETGWFGKVCCINAKSSRCHTACVQTDIPENMSPFCVREDEVLLYQCISRLSRKKSCCQSAPPGSRCLLKCEAVFDSNSPTDQMALDAKMYCSDVDKNISKCVKNYTRMTQSKMDPKESLYCCDQSTSDQCRGTCRYVLNNMTDEQDIMAALVKDCGQPLDEESTGIWPCFLLVDRLPKESEEYEVPLSQSNIDGARLSCCHKAVSKVCRDLCVKLHSEGGYTDRTSWDEFETKCKYRSSEETSMLTCLADVEEPCEPGCSGLEFCSNFNGRPTELFRSCNAHADRSAREDMNTWMEGSIQMPHLSISVQNIRNCQPEMWKAIACTLQVKPCHRKSLGNMICKSDCVEILTKCINQDSLLEPGASIQEMCDILSPADDDAPCISFQDYLYPSEYVGIASEVTHPCSNNPCKNSTVTKNSMCIPDRTYCGEGDVCFQHKCQFGCKLGGSSPFLVPHGSKVRIPDSTIDLSLYKTSNCGQNGLLENFRSVQRIPKRSCTIGGQKREHQSRFFVDCNMCICYSGVSTCSKRQCLSSSPTMEEQRRYTGLPCYCADQFVPVCALNGKTYPSACLARCMEFTDDQLTFGVCARKDHCTGIKCGPGMKCVPNRQVCLSINQSECPQYKCVVTDWNCDDELIRPVCDTDGEEHLNLCLMHQAGKTFAYNGDCKPHCDRENTLAVCGHNGETYSSVCEAWSDHTTVDYYGACQSVGILTDGKGNSECIAIQCPSPKVKNCIGITPPGACCPVCAGEIQVLFSEKIADTMSEALNGEPLTVNIILELLRDHVAVAECDLFGYMTIEGDLVLLVTPIISSPTELQIEACNSEAEKIAALINTQSPTLVSYVHLAPLIAAQTRLSTPTTTNNARHLQASSQVLFCFILYFLQKMYLSFASR